MLTREDVEAREEQLREVIRDLPEDEKLEYFTHFKSRQKDPDTYAALNYIAVAGLHHLYLRRWFRGIFNLVVFGLGVVLIIVAPFVNGANPVERSIVGAIMIAAIALAELPALFRSQLIVQDYNNDLAEHLLYELGSGGLDKNVAQTPKEVDNPYDASN